MNIVAFDSASRPAYLERLNDQQRLAVEHGGGAVAGPLLVIAGAGSGKTNTLAHRVAHLIVKGADPRRILLMTFSRRAASEMTRRVERIVGEVLGRDAAVMTDALTWAGTFHGIGARLLRDYALEIGLDAAFTIHDREDSADLMNLARHELGFSSTESRFPAKGTCLAIYSRAVNAQAPLGEILGAAFPWCSGWHEELRQLFAAYVEAKQAQNVLDYDDLLLYWAQMAAEPAIAEHLASRFDHILVDEYQDTNRLQASILTALKPDGTGLTVVGDDAQSIYSFRAAEVRNILDFPTLFAPEAEVVMLERNYRSTQTILAAANAVIGEASERFTKNLWSERESGERPRLVSVRDEADQANYICEQILAEREAGTALKSQAVLFRASHHSGPLEFELTRRNIPFVKFGGLKFLDAAHVKDVLAVLRFAENPRDRVAGFRVLQLLPGIGPSAANAVVESMTTALDHEMGLAAYRPPQRAAADWPAFIELYAGLRAGAGKWPADLERVRLWYDPARRPAAARADRHRLCLARALSHRTDARSTGRDERPGGPAASRRGLCHPVDDPFGQGSGMEERLRAQRRGRLHPGRPQRRQHGGDRRGTPAALCRHDARQGQPASGDAAALLRAWPGRTRRPACLCLADPLHPGGHPRGLPADLLGAGAQSR